jgi:ligand-binding sensor domain-containing protein
MLFFQVHLWYNTKKWKKDISLVQNTNKQRCQGLSMINRFRRSNNGNLWFGESKIDYEPNNFEVVPWLCKTCRGWTVENKKRYYRPMQTSNLVQKCPPG